MSIHCVKCFVSGPVMNRLSGQWVTLIYALCCNQIDSQKDWSFSVYQYKVSVSSQTQRRSGPSLYVSIRSL